MIITDSIVHQVKKKIGETKTEIIPRDKKLDKSPQVDELFESIRKNYDSKTGKTYGEFGQRSAFKYELNNYLSSRCDFVKFTVKATSIFDDEIKRKSLASGGFLFFAKFSDVDDYLIIVLLNQKPGSSVDLNSLNIISTQHLDVDSLSYACLINISKWKNGENKYLSFAKGHRRATTEVSQYFYDFINCGDTVVSASEATVTLRDSLREYFDDKNVDLDTALQIERDVFTHCYECSKSGDPIHLANISWIVSKKLKIDDVDEFFKFANSEDVGLSDVFGVYIPELKKMRDFSMKSDNLKLTFSKTLLNNRIKLDGKRLIIEGLEDSFINELDKYQLPEQE